MQPGAAPDDSVPSHTPRIGVFVCHCGGNISDVVDVERVAAEVARMPGVVLATAYPFVCSDPGQALIEEKIRELKLDRVVVAACSPTLHQTTFRRTIDRAGPTSTSSSTSTSASRSRGWSRTARRRRRRRSG